MTKAPRAGEVKTRLTPPLTAEEAALLNVCFLRDTATAIAQVTARARGIACFTPAGSAEEYREILPPGFQLIPQRGETFGARLLCAVEDLLAVGFSSVCLIDSDSPLVPARIFAEAAEELARPNDTVVLGPSDDGGYYLIGLKKPHRRLFEEIEWSTAHVCDQTLSRAAELRLSVHLLPNQYDVDDGATLARLCRDLLDSGEAHKKSTAPATKEFLRRIYPQLSNR